MRSKIEHIDSIIKSIVEKLWRDRCPTREDMAAAWKEAAGDAIFKHSKPAAIRKGRLVINVDGSSWLYELTLRKETLLKKMKNAMGGENIKELQFRIGEL